MTNQYSSCEDAIASVDLHAIEEMPVEDEVHQPQDERHRQIQINGTLMGCVMIWEEVEELTIGMDGEGTLIITAPLSFPESSIVRILTQDNIFLSMAIEHAREKLKHPERGWLDQIIGFMASRGSIRIFGRSYKAKVYHGYGEILLEGGEYKIYTPDTWRLDAIEALIEKDMTSRLIQLFHQFQAKYLTRLPELPEAMPYLVINAHQYEPVRVEFETGLIELHPALSQMPLEYVEYIAAASLCTLLDQGDMDAHVRIMDDMMPDWRERKNM